MPTYEVSEQQKTFFEDFGYLVLKGWLKDDVAWIEKEFEGVWADRNERHDDVHARQVVPFIDQRERFCTLIDHPAVVAAADGLLGPDWNYNAGDGSYYVGDTQWHRDGKWRHLTFIKIAVYLDPVTRDTGCLRVIPGTHRLDNGYLPQGVDPNTRWGIPGSEVPAAALESEPGDLVVFNHNMFHSAWGGGTRRRMFTMNLTEHAKTPEQIAELHESIAAHAGYMIDHMHSDVMRSTASPERMRHLRQIMNEEGHLAELSAKQREAVQAAAASA